MTTKSQPSGFYVMTGTYSLCKECVKAWQNNLRHMGFTRINIGLTAVKAFSNRDMKNGTYENKENFKRFNDNFPSSKFLE